MSSRDDAGSPNRREEGSSAGCLALQSGEAVVASHPHAKNIEYTAKHIMSLPARMKT